MSRGWTARRFDTIEVAVVVIFTVVLTAATTAYLVRSLEAKELERISYVAYTAMQEGVPLADRYGPARYSRNEEEWIIRDYFRDKPGGVFVDVGANHYKNDSNTFYLESVLRWSGVAIDPQPSFAAEYRAHRPRTRYFSFFVSDSSDATVKLFEVNQNSLVASADKAFAERAGTNAKDPIYTARAVSVPTIRLTDLLDRLSFSRFDLLSIDVELAEPKVLAGFDIDRFKPSLVCIEAHPQVRQQILDYFAAHGYVVLGRYLRADLQNLYFSPIMPVDRVPVTSAGTDSEQRPKQ